MQARGLQKDDNIQPNLGNGNSTHQINHIPNGNTETLYENKSQKKQSAIQNEMP